MKLTLGEVAALSGGTLHGDASRIVTGLAPVDQAGPGDLTFVDSPAYLDMLKASSAGAAIVRERVGGFAGAQVVAADPRMAFFTVAAIVSRQAPEPLGVSDRAFVDPTAEIGPDVSVFPLAYVGPGAQVGARTILHPHAHVGAGSVVGEDCVLNAGATVGEKVRIGDRVVLHFGAAIGADGFGYLQRDGMNVKVPQIGGVVIEDDVEIGACTCVDRGTLGDTVIGEGTKIDNLVQVAHNCRIGKHAIVVSQAGFGGTTTIGDRAMIGPRAASIDHVTIGADVLLAGQTAAMKDIPNGAKMAGTPAQDHIQWKRQQVYTTKLGALFSRVRELEARLAKVEDEGGDD